MKNKGCWRTPRKFCFCSVEDGFAGVATRVGALVVSSDSKVDIPSAPRPVLVSRRHRAAANPPRRHFAAWTLALLLGLVLGAGSSHAGGYALAFDGNQNYARSVATANIDGLQQGTLECWIRFTNSPPQGGIIMAQTDDCYANGLGWYMRVDGDQGWEFDWANGDAISTSLTNQHLYDGNWHHLAVTYTMDESLQVSGWGWTDGQLTGAGGAADPVVTGISTIMLGAAWNLDGNGGPQQSSQAIIDEVRISDTNWYSATFTPDHCLGTNEHTLACYTMETTFTASLFNFPTGVAVDGAGNVYVTDANNYTIRRITPVGANWVTSIIAGLAGQLGSADGTNAAAQFGWSNSIAVDTNGNVYVADSDNYTIRRIAPVGTNWVTSTIAGLAGQPGSADGTNAAARFGSPNGVAVDSGGNVYVADSDNKTIRRIAPVGTNWVTSTIAGLAGQSGSADGTNAAARFGWPNGVAVDSGGNVYVADTSNNAIRKIAPVGTNWVTTTIAGLAGNLGAADGTNAAAQFGWPNSVAVDSSADVYVSNPDNGTIRKITQIGTNWVTSTIASGFNWPNGVAVDRSDNLYVADNANFTVLRIAPVGTNWITSTMAGLAQVSGSGDNLTTIPDMSGTNLWLFLYGNPAPSLVTGGCVLPPTASFTASPTNGPWPLTVSFTDTSSGTVTNRSWNLGDGTTTNTTTGSFLHTYATAGSNTVNLTVSGPLGSSSLTLTNCITVINPPHLVVTPDSLSYGSVTIGQTNSLSFSVINTGDLPFSGTATGTAPFGVTSGASYNVAGRQMQTVTVAFAPGSATTFNGSVIFTSNGGDSTNTVSGIGLTPGSVAVTPAALDFGMLATGTTAQAGFTVTNSGGTAVSNGSATVTGGPFTIISGAAFSVGGFGSTNVTIQFAPVSAGAFTDSVVFATANGGKATNTVSGTGAIVPVAAFSGTPTNGVTPLAVTFTDSSSGTLTNRHWSFGDGATSNTLAASVVHTYNVAGSNTVQLIASGPVGVSTNTRVNYIIVTVHCDYTLSATNASFGVTGGSNTVTVVASTNLCPWTASSNNSWIQIAGGGVSATGSAVVAYTVLSNEGSSSARAGTMTIAGQTFTVTQTGDTASPTVVLTAPTSGIVSNTIAVSATATDDVAVAQVEFYRDGSVLFATVTTPPYNVNFDTASLGDGSHCFYAKAYDAANNVGGSATNCVTVDNTTPSVPAGLTATAVSTNQIHLSWSASSDGAGSGVAGYEVFRDGTQIATTATTDYSDAGLALGNEYCYQVAAYDGAGHTSASSAAACAQTFVTPGSLLGRYHGLAIQTNAPSHASSGSLTLVLGKTGSFAANLAMGGVKSAFKGQFDDAGNATGTVTRKGLSSLQVVLHLDVASGTDQITGTVSDGVFTSELLADRAVYSRTKPSPWAGSYTVVLEPPGGSGSDIPLGYGYGTLIVATTGGGQLSGVLGDGTKITGSAPVSKHGTWPLYDVLYKNQGSCIGWVAFDTNDTLAATVDWFRPSLPTSAYYPAGFTTNVTLVGEEYLSPSAGGPNPAGNREITLGGGNLANSIVKTVAVDTVGNVIVFGPNSANLKLKLAPATGQFSGSFTHPALNKTISFKALTLQSEGSSAGYFLGTNQSGYVIIEPAP